MTQAKELELFSKSYRVQIYKQTPGADIEPGWYYVLHGPWYDPERPRWSSPYSTKRQALTMARAALKQAEVAP